ncbi:ABC transporter permease [Ruminococcaceae bacterium OttesenSCG-928-I18]|nr:ABC transporter permease [Ruminococcaceae bacterium OttesenSCG-928-I18]
MKRVYLVLLFSFLYVPIAIMIAFSFNSEKSRTIFGGFSFRWYEQLFRDEMVLSALALSVFIAIVSAVLATLIGTMASVGINRMGRISRSVTLNISYIPILNPEIITGVSMMLLFVVAKNGLAGLAESDVGALAWLAKNLLGIPSLLITHITFNLPYVLFMVSPKLRQMDIRLYEAALDLGCNERQAFFKVVLPEIMPAIFSAFLICLTYSIDDFTISYFTAGNRQTLPIAIYAMTRRRVSPEINALSAIIFFVILAIILVANLRERRGAYKGGRILPAGK